MNNWSIIKNVLLLFLSWKLALLLVTFLSLSFLPSTNQLGNIITDKNSLHYWERWANWDGQQYLSISQIGHTGYKVAFFPLYPLLIRLFSLTGVSNLWAGLILANLFTLLAIFFLYKLAILDYSAEVTKKIILSLLIFPTSFFLGAVYTESLFLLLSLSAFYYARKNYWLIAFLLAGLTAVTRLVGIAVIIAVLFEYYFNHKQQLSSALDSRINQYLIYLTLLLSGLIFIKAYFFNSLPFLLIGSLQVFINITTAIFLLFILIYIVKNIVRAATDKNQIINNPLLLIIVLLTPLVSFCFYLYQTVDNPLAFLNQQGWGRSITFPWVPLINDGQFLITKGFFALGQTHLAIIEYFFAWLLLIIFIIACLKLRKSYLIYIAISILLIFSSGTFLSIARLTLTIFPIYFLIGNIKNQQLFNSWVIFSATLLGLFSVLFMGFYWLY